MKIQLAGVVMALAFISAACAGAARTPAPATSALDTVAPVITPTPTASASIAPSSPSLAAQYAGIATRGDASVAKCTKDAKAAAGSLTRSKAVARECLAVGTSYVAELQAVTWGPVRPQADSVIEALDTIDGLLGQMAAATTAAAFRAADEQFDRAVIQLVVAADALRAALGLPAIQL